MISKSNARLKADVRWKTSDTLEKKTLFYLTELINAFALTSKHII